MERLPLLLPKFSHKREISHWLRTTELNASALHRDYNEDSTFLFDSWHLFQPSFRTLRELGADRNCYTYHITSGVVGLTSLSTLAAGRGQGNQSNSFSNEQKILQVRKNDAILYGSQ